MGFFFKLSLALVLVFAFANPSSAQNSPQDYLDSHNAARAQVGVGPLSWDRTLESYAQSYAAGVRSTNRCSHLVRSGGPYGENLAFFFPDLTGKQAVSIWVAEKANYDYPSNSCPGGFKECRHYTQVVWRHTARIGCARVSCKSGFKAVICSYDPPGNVPGRRPY